jgi:hypothetical protein
MLATMWLDIVFILLFVTQIETITVAPGTADGYGSAVIHADYTHALLGAFVLGAISVGVAGTRWVDALGSCSGQSAFRTG